MTQLADEKGDAAKKAVVASVWHDSDDDVSHVSLVHSRRLRKLRETEDEAVVTGSEYTKRLRRQFERIYEPPRWVIDAEKREAAKQRRHEQVNTYATSSDSEEGGPSDMMVDPFQELFLQSDAFTNETHSRESLAAGTLDIRVLRDANQKALSHSAVQSIAFHPSKPFLITGGYDRTVRMFSIDGKANPLLTSAHLRSMRIETCSFSADGTVVFVGGRRRYMYAWALEEGRIRKISRMYGHEETQRSFERFVCSPDGELLALFGSAGTCNLISAHTGQWVQEVKVGDEIADMAWGRGGEEASSSPTLYVLSTMGEVTEWRGGRIVARWQDEGAVTGTRIAVADAWIAVGSRSGIVNLYARHEQRDDETQTYRKPTRVLTQLTTPISELVFNSTGELLVMASRAKKDALRIVHTASGTVFSNWPTSRTKIGRVSSVALSAGSELLAVGDERGRVGLWNIKHYST